ncbi:Rad51-domain-containing protein, partial [Hysterangium stoloniferum]
DFITTGDSYIDEIFGGGIMCGVVTELVGESASGKTQLALQVSLLTQLSRTTGGVSGSTCYLTINGNLPTTRLLEISQKHDLMKCQDSDISHIHTRSISSVPELRHVLKHGVPIMVENLSKPASGLPLRLLVLDSLGALFRPDVKTTSKTLFERSQELGEMASIIHSLASTYHLAILVINEVNPVFERLDASVRFGDDDTDRVLYADQARWFSRASNTPNEDSTEAALGLVWANQIGLRVLLTRTGRRRYILEPNTEGNGHLKYSKDNRLASSKIDEATLVRRCSVIFSNVAAPCSIDFIVSPSGVM